ncbi:ATP-binding cassette domain-containing protein [Micromonospora sp. DR5-3]|uniref:ABC transporter ATP-binding protein n=1 Tax=unclassified Micromonospora TaxID=2617518 RepID=UPI0011D7291B|nr:MULTISPECIES: ATP-binding cassette domain-containing protein [unclassified Micromonospora]MCW3813111.1 ATP-binding cassette domain-containing protein [Micromonospora sp. DR5-3]TYC25908.1 ATP-binding cassette domain-containing protein [Micromonospora sp. MP36]
MDVTPGSAGGPSAASITLERIRKRYPDGTEAVRELSLEVKAGELVVLIGPSGCGKSTVLRMINRLIEPTDGRILLGDDDVTRVDPVALRRRIGYVIQNVGLFPHQTVAANVATVPGLLGWPRGRTRDRVNELLELVGLDPAQFGRRYPHELSGGQRQRVGVARALAADPVVLLMDEPFSAVDPIVRTRLQEEFLRLQAEVRKTIVLVTHDLDEAVRLGDRIAVLSEGGRLEQYDTPAALLGSPASPFVREFVGADRGIRRLAVTPVTREVLEPLPTGDGSDLPALPLGGSAYDALGALLSSAAERAVVTEDGRPVGLLSRSRLLELGAVPD